MSKHSKLSYFTSLVNIQRNKSLKLKMLAIWDEGLMVTVGMSHVKCMLGWLEGFHF